MWPCGGQGPQSENHCSVPFMIFLPLSLKTSHAVKEYHHYSLVYINNCYSFRSAGKEAFVCGEALLYPLSVTCGIKADIRVFEYSELPRIRTFPACDFDCSFHVRLVSLLRILYVLGACFLPNCLAALPLEGTDNLNAFIAHIISYFDIVMRGYYQNRRRRY